MSRYASSTTVSPEKSRAEIERTVTRYGADSFGYGWQDDQAMITFRVDGKLVRFMLAMPDRDDEEFTHTPSKRRKRNPDDAHREWEKGCRQIWRALALVVKAKLEAVEAGIVTFEEEFLPYLVLPNGQTVAKWVLPELAKAYETGKAPKLLMPWLSEHPSE